MRDTNTTESNSCFTLRDLVVVVEVVVDVVVKRQTSLLFDLYVALQRRFEQAELSQLQAALLALLLIAW